MSTRVLNISKSSQIIYINKQTMDINNILSRPADEFGNDESLEEMWAAKAFEHAEIYFNLICSVDPKLLHLTSVDETIHTTFRSEFPDMQVKKVDENEMKSRDGKMKWRFFCERFKILVANYNFGTLLRINCEENYSEVNSILVTKIQFLAIELARNKEGFNDKLRSSFKGKLCDKSHG